MGPVGRLPGPGRSARRSAARSRFRAGRHLLPGGEPFFQPAGLWELVRALRERGCRHLLVYSGYTYERLRRMAARQPAIGAVLDDIEVLIDGPFVQGRAASAGPWTGSGNQRVIDLLASRHEGRVVLWRGEETRPTFLGREGL